MGHSFAQATAAPQHLGADAGGARGGESASLAGKLRHYSRFRAKRYHGVIARATLRCRRGLGTLQETDGTGRTIFP